MRDAPCDGGTTTLFQWYSSDKWEILDGLGGFEAVDVNNSVIIKKTIVNMLSSYSG